MSKIIGAHSVIHSTNPNADRAFFRDIFKFTNIDAGGGWLIFGLPASEVAFHPSAENNLHQFYLLCDDVKSFVKTMKTRGFNCSSVMTFPWGMLTELTLPGGGKVGVYQPKHKRPKATPVKTLKIESKSLKPKSISKKRVLKSRKKK